MADASVNIQFIPTLIIIRFQSRSDVTGSFHSGSVLDKRKQIDHHQHHPQEAHEQTAKRQNKYTVRLRTDIAKDIHEREPRQTHHLLPADTHQAIQERSESRHSDRSDEISELNMLGDDAQSTHHLGTVDRVNATHRKDGDKEQQHDDDAYRFRHPVVEGIVFRVRGHGVRV